jgi:hypothetical protein
MATVVPSRFLPGEGATASRRTVVHCEPASGSACAAAAVCPIHSPTFGPVLHPTGRRRHEAIKLPLRSSRHASRAPAFDPAASCSERQIATRVWFVEVVHATAGHPDGCRCNRVRARQAADAPMPPPAVSAWLTAACLRDEMTLPEFLQALWGSSVSFRRDAVGDVLRPETAAQLVPIGTETLRPLAVVQTLRSVTSKLPLDMIAAPANRREIFPGGLHAAALAYGPPHGKS